MPEENPTIVAAGPFTLGCTLFHLGERKQAPKHFEEVLARDDPQDYPFLLHAYGPALQLFQLLEIEGYEVFRVDTRPVPLPATLVVNNGSKTQALVASSMPHPASVTESLA